MGFAWRSRIETRCAAFSYSLITSGSSFFHAVVDAFAHWAQP